MNRASLLGAFLSLLVGLEAAAQTLPGAPEESKKEPVEDYEHYNKKEIVELNQSLQKIKGLGKYEIKVNLKSKNPYSEAFDQQSELIQNLKDELLYAKQVLDYNSLIKSLGKAPIQINFAQKFPYKVAAEANSEKISNMQYEASTKISVESMLKALKKMGKPLKAKLDLKLEDPYSKFSQKILQEYPEAESYAVALESETRLPMACAEGWENLLGKLESKKKGERCEAGEQPAFDQLISSVKKALAATTLGETEDEIRLRETETLKLVDSDVNAIEAFRLRPGFKDCGLSLAEMSVIAAYTGSFYRSLNSALREGKEETYSAAIATLNSGLRKLAAYAGEVRRGASNLGPDLAKLQVGSTVEFKSFTSTAAFDGGFGGPFQFVISTCSGRYIAPLSVSHFEEEVLIPSGSKMEVLEIGNNDVGKVFKLKEICK